MSKRVVLTMSDELVNLVDRFATFNNVSRAAAVSVLCSQALSQTEALTTFKRMLEMADNTEPKVEERTVTEKKPSVSYGLYNL